MANQPAKTKHAATRKSQPVARKGRKPKGSRSELHYVLISKNGTLTIVSRESGAVTAITGGDVKAFADIVAQRQALGKQLAQTLVERGYNGGSWEDLLFIESFK